MRDAKGRFTKKASEKVLILRSCKADGSSSHGFVWPKRGHVEAPDWKPTKECGNGLHGLLWGEGDGGLLCWDNDALWIVVEVDKGSVIDLRGKVKFPSGEVVFSGDRKAATDFLIANGAANRAVIGAFITGGDGATVTGSYGATVTGGDGATVTGGDWATLILSWRDCNRKRLAIAYVGENGIKPNVKYHLNEKHEFVEA